MWKWWKLLGTSLSRVKLLLEIKIVVSEERQRDVKLLSAALNCHLYC